MFNIKKLFSLIKFVHRPIHLILVVWYAAFSSEMLAPHRNGRNTFVASDRPTFSEPEDPAWIWLLRYTNLMADAFGKE